MLFILIIFYIIFTDSAEFSWEYLVSYKYWDSFKNSNKYLNESLSLVKQKQFIKSFENISKPDDTPHSLIKIVNIILIFN